MEKQGVDREARGAAVVDMGPIGEALLALARAPLPEEALPASLLALVDASEAEPRSTSLKRAAGMAAAAMLHERAALGWQIFLLLGRLGSERPGLQEELRPLLLLIQLNYALEFLDPKTALASAEPLGLLRAMDEEDPLRAHLRTLAAIQERFDAAAGEEHGQWLAALMLPPRSKAGWRTRMEERDWLLGEECAALVAQHLATAAEAERPFLEHLYQLLDILAERTPEQRAGLESGARRAQELRRQVQVVASLGLSPERLFERVDALPPSALQSADELDGFVRALKAQRCASVEDVAVLWSAARTGAALSPELAGRLAGELALHMKLLSSHPAVSPRRIQLLERALAAVKEDDEPGWSAQLHYALAHEHKHYEELTPERLKSQLAWRDHAWRALLVFRQVGNMEFAGLALTCHLEALRALPAAQQGGPAAALAHVRKLLAVPKEQAAPRLRAALLCELGMLLIDDPAGAAEALAAAEEAHLIFQEGDDQHARWNRVRAALVLTGLALRGLQRGEEGARARFDRWFSEGIKDAQAAGDQQGEGLLRVQFSAVLEADENFHGALEQVQRALALSPPHAPLLWRRAQLRAAVRQDGWLAAALDDLDQAEALQGATPAAQLIWDLVMVRAQVLEQGGRYDEAFRALARAEQRLAAQGATALVATVLVRTLRLLRLTNDREAARQVLERVLQRSVGMSADASGPLAAAARAWVDLELGYHQSACEPWQLSGLEALCQAAPAEQAAPLRERLRILRCRVLGDPPVPVLLQELEQAAAQDPSPRGDQSLLDALHLAHHKLGVEADETQRLARRAEERTLASELTPGEPGHAGILVDLAVLRLQQGGPDPRKGQAALRLLDRAVELVPLAQMPPGMYGRTREARLFARTEVFGHQAGATATALAQEGRALWMEAKLVAAERQWSHERMRGFLGNLCNALRTCSVPEAQPVRALAAEIERAHDLERDDDLARLRAHWPADRRIAERQADPLYGWLVDDDLDDLLLAEHAALAGVEFVQASEVAQRLLKDLLPRLPQVALPRAQRALARSYINHPSADRASLFPKIMAHLQAAEAAWDREDVPGHLQVLHDMAHELWRASDFLPEHEHASVWQQALAVLTRALGHPRVAEFPAEHADLLLRRGMVDHYRQTNPFARRGAEGRQGMRDALPWLERARQVCPPEDAETRFQVLVGLANVQRDLARALADDEHGVEQQESEALLAAAIAHYQEALALQGGEERIPEIDLARGQKCLADALRHRGHSGDLDEARRLLHLSLAVRERFSSPFPQVESLESLAEVELARHEAGDPAALAAAREAAQRGLARLPQSLDHPLRYALNEVLQRAAAQASATPSADAAPDEEYMERKREAWHAAPLRAALGRDPLGLLDSSLFSQAARARREKSLLHKDVSKWLTAFPSMFKRHGRQGSLEIPAGPVLEELRQLIARGMSAETVDEILAPQAPSRRWSPAERRAYRQLLAQAVGAATAQAGLSWDAVARLQHQAAFQFQQDRADLTPQEWRLEESWARAALEAVRCRDAENPDLMELYRDLGLVVMLGPTRGLPRRYSEARELFSRAMKLAQQHRDTPMQVDLTIDLGTLLDHMADDDPALRDESIKVYSALLEGPQAAELTDHQRQLALANRGWSRVLLPPARHPQAARLAVADLEEAVRLCGAHEEMKDPRARAVQHLASALCALSKYDPAQRPLALQRATEALALYEALGNTREVARCHHILGLYHMDFGGPAALPLAFQHTLQALQQRRDNPIELWESLGNLVMLRRMMNAPFGATPFDLPLLRDVDALISKLRELGLPERLMATHQYGLWLTEIMDDPEEVLPAYLRRLDAALADAEALWDRSATAGERQQLSAALAGFAAEQVVLGQRAGEDPLQLWRHAQRGKARGLLHDRQATAETDKQPQRLARLAELRAQLRALGERPDPEAGHQRLVLQEEIHRLQQSAAAPLPSIDHAALRARLLQEPQAALLDFSLAIHGAVVLIAHLDREGGLVVNARPLAVNGPEVLTWLTGHRGEREGWLEVQRAAAQARERDEDTLPTLEAAAVCLDRLLLDLHEKLLGPATAGLLQAGVVDLIVCAHGPLCALPLAASCRPAAGGAARYLIEDFRSLRLCPSAGAFLRERPPQALAARRGLIYMAADAELPGAAASGAQIHNLWRKAGLQVRLEQGQEGRGSALVNTVLEALGEVDLAYLLCHGVFEPGHPAGSGLKLGEGALLSAAVLASWSGSLCAQQIFLSACQSGRVHGGVDAEWIGVAGQLLRSGASMVVGTLWDVLYVETMALSTAYFAALLPGKFLPAQALGEAMRQHLGRVRGDATQMDDRDARVQRLKASPLGWAGFLLLGLG